MKLRGYPRRQFLPHHQSAQKYPVCLDNTKCHAVVTPRARSDMRSRRERTRLIIPEPRKKMNEIIAVVCVYSQPGVTKRSGIENSSTMLDKVIRKVETEISRMKNTSMPLDKTLARNCGSRVIRTAPIAITARRTVSKSARLKKSGESSMARNSPIKSKPAACPKIATFMRVTFAGEPAFSTNLHLLGRIVLEIVEFGNRILAILAHLWANRSRKHRQICVELWF